MLIRATMSEDVRYAFAVGWVRVLEKHLLTRAQMARLAEDEPEALLRTLADAGYEVDPLESNLDHIDFDEVLQKNMRQTYELAEKLTQDPKLTALLPLRYACNNLKAALKARVAKGEMGKTQAQVGALPQAALKGLVTGEALEKIDFHKKAKAYVAEALAAYERTSAPRIIDVMLDKALYAELITRAEELGNEFVLQLFRIEIDLDNLRNLARVRMSDDAPTPEHLDELLMEGGFIDRASIDAAVEESLENLPQRFSHTPYDGVLKEGIDAWQRSGSLGELERGFDDYRTEYLKQAKITSFGVEPLVAYVLAKEVEARNLRNVFVGRVNRLPAENMAKRLRESYV